MDFESYLTILFVLIGILVLFDLFNSLKLFYLIYARFLKKKSPVFVIPGISNIDRTNIFSKIFYRFRKWLRKFFSLKSLASKSLIVKKRSRSINTKVFAQWFFFWILNNFAGLLLVGIFFFMAFGQDPGVEKTVPGNTLGGEEIASPIVFKFNVPIQADIIDKTVSSETEGEWSDNRKNFGDKVFATELVFKPKYSLLPDEEIKIELRNLKNIFGELGQKKVVLFTFKAGEHNDLTAMNIFDDERDVELNRDLRFEFQYDLGGFTDWEFEFDKDVFFKKSEEKNKIVLNLTENLEQGEEYTLSIYRTVRSLDLFDKSVEEEGEKELLHAVTFYTAKPPEVDSIEPGYTLLPEDEIRIIFDQEMDRDSVEAGLIFEPEVKGEAEWLDDRVMIFKSETEFEKNLFYKVKLISGIQSLKKSYLKEDYEYSLKGIGEVEVAKWTPSEDEKIIELDTNIEVVFDQEVNKDSAEENFSIEPSIEGIISWEGNKLIFDPENNLAKETEYAIYLDSGIKSIYGDDSVEDFVYKFKTKGDSFVIDVPLFYQTHRYTCNITAARMILAYKGVKKGELQIYNELPKDETPCDPINKIWGNPHVGYVGNIDGNKVGGCISSNGKSAYGVYWEPIDAYLKEQGLDTEIKRGWSMEGLAEEISKGHPAILWWQNGAWEAKDSSWATPEGEEIYAINGMHSEVAVGFVGDVDSPTHIIVLDPWRGLRKLSREYVEETWKWFDETAVVIY